MNGFEHINIVRLHEGNSTILFDTWTSVYGCLRGEFGRLNGVPFMLNCNIAEHAGQPWNYYKLTDLEKKLDEWYQLFKTAIAKDGRFTDFINSERYWVMNDTDKSAVMDESRFAKEEVADTKEIYESLAGLVLLLKSCGDFEEGEVLLAVNQDTYPCD